MRVNKKIRKKRLWNRYKKGAIKISRTRIFDNRVLHDISWIRDNYIAGYTNILYPRTGNKLKNYKFSASFRQYILTLVSFFDFKFYRNDYKNIRG